VRRNGEFHSFVFDGPIFPGAGSSGGRRLCCAMQCTTPILNEWRRMGRSPCKRSLLRSVNAAQRDVRCVAHRATAT